MARGKNRDYLGLHAGKLRYHQWINLAMTIENGYLTAYQDGEVVGGVQYGEQDLLNTLQNNCIYEKNMDISITQHLQGSPYSMAGLPLYDDLQTNPFSAHVSNTVLYVASQPHAKGAHSTVGMMHELLVIRNAAFPAAQSQELSERTRPPRWRSMEELLAASGITVLKGLCLLEPGDDVYLSLQWGICPNVVCGAFCVNERIYVGDYFTNSAEDTIMSHNQERLPGQISTEQELPEIGYPMADDDSGEMFFSVENLFAEAENPLEASAGSILGFVLLDVLFPLWGPI